MTRPRSRSASSNLAAARSATPASDDEAAAGATERAAATAAAETEMEFMRDTQTGEDGMSPRPLSRPRRLKPVPAILSLSGGYRLTWIQGCPRRHLGLEGIARREMSKWRHEILAAV